MKFLKVLLLSTLTLPLTLASAYSAPRCLDNICEENIVSDNIGYFGEVVKIYDNHTADVALINVPAKYNFKLSELGTLTECYQEFCEYQMVVDKWGNPGQIYALFNNGRIHFVEQETGDFYYLTIKDIAKINQ
ncbi:hypothetical protein M899_2292 [Bacteriovorax sp. BSW11_IV]|uniref:hypothetical protein n=1 Tax=Bacteriovorax sp. BSW11_IV TaxID=1353529 RepID=UPI00038A0462|nr:hypothetical protein [Bacteriovorax sp. BSW11_IV]EQC48794.1 hypothetical protein M899_2292 [Bacteriovorax sp. BSW11_IV]